MAALQRVLLAHVPVGDQFLAVGIGLHVEQDDVVEEAACVSASVRLTIW